MTELPTCCQNLTTDTMTWY